MSIKKQLLARLRRNKMPLARRVRLLPEQSLEKLSSSGELNSPQLHDRQAVQAIAQEFIARCTINSAFMHDPSISDLDKLTDEFSPVLKYASILLSNSPNSDSDADALTVLQFNQLKNNPVLDIDNLPRLAREAMELTKQNTFALDSTQEFLKKATHCLDLADEVFSKFENKLCQNLKINVSNGSGFSIVSIPDSERARLNDSALKLILGLPKGNDILIIGNEFKNGRAPIYGMTQEQKENIWNIKDGPLGATVSSEPYNSLFFKELENSNADVLLGNSNNLGQKSAITILSEHKESSMENPADDFFNVLPEDLEAMSYIHSESGVCGPSFRNQQLNCLITISANDRWFVDEPNGRKLKSLSDIDSVENVKIRATSSSDVSLELSPLIISRLKKNKTLNLSVYPDTSKNWLTLREHKLAPNTIELPNPALSSVQDRANEHIKSQNRKGYIDKRYTGKELSEIMLKQGVKDVSSFLIGLEETLYSLNANTLASIDVESTGLQSGNPYYISMTLYSQTQQGPHIRRVACCVHDSKWDLPTKAQLAAIGLTESSFLESALSKEEADIHLLKPLNQGQGNRFAISLHNQKDTLASLKKACPAVSKKVNHCSFIDRQLLIKQEQLGLRRDPSVTFTLGEKNSRPITFFDTPGNKESLKQKLRAKNGRCLSGDSSASIAITESSVILHDYKSGLSGLLGTPESVLMDFHISQKTPTSITASGDPFKLAQYHRIVKLLSQSSDSLPERKRATPLSIASVPNTTPEWTQENSDIIIDLWDKYQDSVNLELSASDNLTIFAKQLEPLGIHLDSVIAGGVGGKTGRTFLLALQESNKALFTVATAGKKLNLSSMLNGGNPRINPDQASLTVRDLFTGNINRLQKANSEIVSHYQMSHTAIEILSRLEPTTSKVAVSSVEALARHTGLPTSMVANLYKLAYKEKQSSGNSYKQFLPSIDEWSPMGDHNVLEHIVLFDSLNDKLKVGSTEFKNTILTHNIKQILKNQTNEFLIENEKDTQVVDMHFLQDNRLQVVIKKTPNANDVDEELIKKGLEPLLNLLHIKNGAHNVLTKSVNLPQSDCEDAHKLLMSFLGGNAGSSSAMSLESVLRGLPVESIAIKPHAKVYREWLEGAMLYALEISTSPPNYNRTIPIDVIEKARIFSDELFNGLPIPTKQAKANLNQIFDVSSRQFEALTLIKETISSIPGAPISNDGIIAKKRKYAEQASSLGFIPTPVKYSDIILPLIQSNKLTKEVSDSLYSAMQRDFEPQPDNSFAKQIFQQVRRELQEAPALIKETSILANIESGFKVSSNHPLNDALIKTMIINERLSVELDEKPSYEPIKQKHL